MRRHVQITEVQLTSQDPEAAGSRYAELLGLPITTTRDQVELQAGSTRLVLVPGPTGPGVHHLAFTVPQAWFARALDDLTARVQPISVEGRSVFEGPAHWNSSSVYFAGPEGVLLEYIVRRDLPDAVLVSTAGVNSPVAAISEVGVAVPDVRALVDQLQAPDQLESPA